jgi:hypothetical protein
MPKQLLSNQSEWVASNFNNLADPETPLVWYTDPKTGDIYNSNEEYTDLIASGKAINNPDLQYLGLYPTKAMELYGLQTTDPKNYYNQLSKSLGDTAYDYYGRLLKEYKPVTEQIESLKTKSPQDYYNTKFELLGKQIGWNTGFGESSKNDSITNELKSLIPEAKAAGFNDNQINSIIANNINTGSVDSQNRIAQQKAGSTSNFWKENLIGTAKTAAIMAAMIAGGTGAESLMAGGAEGAAGGAGAAGGGSGGFGLTASSAPSLTTGLEVGTGSALTGTGAGAAGTYAGGAAGSLGSAGWVAPTIGGSTSTGIGLSANSIPSLVNGLEVGTGSALYGTGSSGLSASDVYKAYNRAKTISNLLTGGTGKTGQQSINPQALAGALQATQTPMEQFGGLYRMNEKPFLQQQTASISPDSYNVSGQNIASPTAPTNQLLANLLYPKA